MNINKYRALMNINEYQAVMNIDEYQINTWTRSGFVKS